MRDDHNGKQRTGPASGYLDYGIWVLDVDGATPIYVHPRNERVSAMFRTRNARRVARDNVGRTVVSTVFLSVDHAYSPGPPVLWETMVFGGPMDGELERYTSRRDAERGHWDMVRSVRWANFHHRRRNRAT